MLNSKNERELAYLVKIDSISAMDADRLECAHIGGWNCVVGKGEFKAGDIGVYFEIDSKLPEAAPFTSMEFLKSKGYKIKSQKIRGVVSQGLLMPISTWDWSTGCDDKGEYVTTNVELPVDEGRILRLNDDSKFLTKRLDVAYAVFEDNDRKASSVDKYNVMTQRNPKLSKTKIWRWLYKRDWGKKFLFFLFGKKADKAGAWPYWVTKTDEERVQNMPWILQDKSDWIATEKIDGTSTTFTMKKKSRRKNQFYVCSRNKVFLKSDVSCYYDTNVYIEMTEKYRMEEVLSKIMKELDLDWVTIQGETYGAQIQKRDYSLGKIAKDLPEAAHDFMAFNFITSKDGRWNSVEAAKFLHKYGIHWVPILNEHFIFPDTVEELLKIASGPSIIDGDPREGIVFRSQDGVKSFKAVSNEYLLKYHQ